MQIVGGGTETAAHGPQSGLQKDGSFRTAIGPQLFEYVSEKCWARIFSGFQHTLLKKKPY